MAEVCLVSFHAIKHANLLLNASLLIVCKSLIQLQLNSTYTKFKLVKRTLLFVYYFGHTESFTKLKIICRFNCQIKRIICLRIMRHITKFQGNVHCSSQKKFEFNILTFSSTVSENGKYSFVIKLIRTHFPYYFGKFGVHPRK